MLLVLGALARPPQLALLGFGLLFLVALAVVLRRAKPQDVNASLVSGDRGSWLAFTMAAIAGGLVSMALAVEAANAKDSLFLFWLSLGIVLLALGGVSLRYTILLIIERTLVAPLGFERFSDYDQARRKQGWDLDRIAHEVGRSPNWVIAARRRYEGAESLGRIVKD